MSLPLSRIFVHKGRLRSGWRVGLYLAAYLVGLIALQVPIVALYVGWLMARGTTSTPALLDSLQPERLPLWLYLALKAGELAMLLPLTYLLCRLVDRRAFADLGFRLRRGWPADLLLGLALGAAQIALIVAIEWAAGWLEVGLPDGQTLARAGLQGAVATALFALVALGEELMFRGYLQVNLGEGMRGVPALVLTSILFGLFHALNPHFRWIALLNIVLAGAVLGYARAVTGSLWLPMAYHFSWNWVQGPLFALPVSGVRYGGLLAVADRGAVPLLTGAAFGPEGGLIGTLILLSAFPVLWLWDKRRRVAP